MALPRMRTAAGVLAEIKTQDPATEVTLHYLRHLIATKQVPIVQVGRKKLVNVEAVIAYIAAGTPQNTAEVLEPAGQIRRVEV